MAARVKPQISTKRDLKVCGLDHKVTDSDVAKFFEQVAPVLSVKMYHASAYVTFSDIKQAINARDSLHLKSLNGKPVSIMLAKPYPVQTNGRSDIFNKNLGASISSEFLRRSFSCYGPVLSCKVMHPEGYGYVKFEKEEDALEAIIDMRHQDFGDTTIVVSPFMTKKARDEEKEAKLRKTVYIKNLSEDVDSSYLSSLFGRYGRVRSLSTSADSFRQCRGTGYVTFEVEDEALSAVELLDGHTHDRRTWHVKHAWSEFQIEKKSGKKKVFTQVPDREPVPVVPLGSGPSDCLVPAPLHPCQFGNLLGVMPETPMPFETSKGIRLVRQPNGWYAVIYEDDRSELRKKRKCVGTSETLA